MGHRIDQRAAADQRAQPADALPLVDHGEVGRDLQPEPQRQAHRQVGQQQAHQETRPARLQVEHVGPAQPAPQQDQVEVAAQRAGDAECEVQPGTRARSPSPFLARLLRDPERHQQGQQGDVEHHVGDHRRKPARTGVRVSWRA